MFFACVRTDWAPHSWSMNSSRRRSRETVGATARQSDGSRATTTLRSVRGRADARIHPALQSSTATEPPSAISDCATPPATAPVGCSARASPLRLFGETLTQKPRGRPLSPRESCHQPGKYGSGSIKLDATQLRRLRCAVVSSSRSPDWPPTENLSRPTRKLLDRPSSHFTRTCRSSEYQTRPTRLTPLRHCST